MKDKRRVTGKVNVFATPELQEAARIRSGLRSSFRAQTACGLEDNIRICPVIQSDKVQTWFDNARTNLDDFYFQKVVPSILARKEEDREAAIEIAKTPGYEGGIGTLFNERLYPAGEAELREKYSLTLRWHPLPDPEHDVRVGCSVEQAKKFAADEISRHEKLAASAHRDVIERIEKSLQLVLGSAWYLHGRAQGFVPRRRVQGACGVEFDSSWLQHLQRSGIRCGCIEDREGCCDPSIPKTCVARALRPKRAGSKRR